MVGLQHSDLSKWWPTRDFISSCSALISNNVYLRSKFTVIPDVPRETLLSQYQSFILTGKPGLLMPYPTYMMRVSLNCASFTFSNPSPGRLPDDTGNFYDRMGNVPRGTFEASERCGSIEYCGSVPHSVTGLLCDCDVWCSQTGEKRDFALRFLLTQTDILWKSHFSSTCPLHWNGVCCSAVSHFCYVILCGLARKLFHVKHPAVTYLFS